MTVEEFLAPLARIAAKTPDLEAQVIWAANGGWQPQDDTTDLLDAEEIAFYAEGMLLEGFSMIWEVLAEDDTPAKPAFVRLYFWQGAMPEAAAPDAIVVTRAEWSLVALTPQL